MQSTGVHQFSRGTYTLASFDISRKFPSSAAPADGRFDGLNASNNNELHRGNGVVHPLIPAATYKPIVI